MIKKAVFIVCLLITMAFSGPAFGLRYNGYDTWGGNWHDANKTGTGDINLCWAAAASNILDWAGYDTTRYFKETEIFQDFNDHWTDDGGLPAYGWYWYLYGVNPSQGWAAGWSQVNEAGGGNNWPLVRNVYHEETDHAQAMSEVDSFLHLGYGVTLAIYTTGGAHALTCWGYDYTGTGANDYQSVWVTDSDDSAYGIVKYPISLTGGVWYLNGGTYSGWHIDAVEALDRNVTGVPEPATLLLLGFGLLGLAGLRKMNYPAASCGVSKTARNEASFGEYDPERLEM